MSPTVDWTQEAWNKSEDMRALAMEAGRQILSVYSQDFEVTEKADTSPLTAADMASHYIILKGLAALDGPLGAIPIISEEGELLEYSQRSAWEAWWLIDPLDGTKEFVKRNGEFTVNIALIARSKPGSPGIPVAGWVFAPVLHRLYEGIAGHGAVRIHQNLKDGRSGVKKLPMGEPADPPRIVASRSHRSPETDAVIHAVTALFGVGDIVSSGSSLKLCQIAEGSAEFYPRCAPTMEWDTAAADAVCRAAGFRVVQAVDGTDLVYGKENLLNPWFIVGQDGALISCAVEAVRSTQVLSDS
ncbi:MAG: 3'(2'),5'-bisphosphate nucleotidase CysQ [Spirochaetaceae bacterium]|nr:3'(2'),5'-bisphosphate nucleotidase CysQ [Spirochaetaceae bacterium]MDT8298523.1 3'(2'),5'-bisphosphate nucleotidase CysQ [Spirochaetaceae bacterium]